MADADTVAAAARPLPICRLALPFKQYQEEGQRTGAREREWEWKREWEWEWHRQECIVAETCNGRWRWRWRGNGKRERRRVGSGERYRPTFFHCEISFYHRLHLHLDVQGECAAEKGQEHDDDDDAADVVQWDTYR